MELYQLRAFVTASRVGGLTRAAEQLHLSQPAISQQVKALEEELGVRLFERTPTGILPTAAGRELLPLAERALAAAGELLGHARGLRGEVVGTARLGTIIDATFTQLGNVLRAMRERYPRLDVETRHSSSGLVLESVRRGELDAAYFMAPTPEADVVSLPLSPMRYRVVAPPALRAEVEAAGWEEIARLPWIGTPWFSSQTRLMREMFEARGLQPPRVCETDQEDSRRRLIGAGLGLGLIREDLAQEAARAGELVLWPEYTAHTMLWLIHLSGREHEPVIAAVRAVMRAVWPFLG